MEEEIRELARRAQQGDREALSKLIVFRDNYATNPPDSGVPDRLVVQVAACYIPCARKACGISP